MKPMVFTETNWASITDMKKAYLAMLQGKTDGFHADLLFGATPYRMETDGHAAGFFALSDGWDGGKMLTGFYLEKAYSAHSQDLFSRIVTEFNVTAALVASNDAPLVALAFEKMHALGTAFVMQAYNFTYGTPARPAEFGRECLVPVQPSEYEEMNSLTDKQWDGCFDNPAFRYFALKKDGETLGYGSIFPVLGDESRMDIGNFTLPQHRRKGVGRSLLIHLAQTVLDEGKTPVAGCWYGNKESIPTIKSSGFLPEVRLFYVKFIK